MKVLFFASFREQLKCDQTVLNALETEPLETVGDVLELLRQRGEPWSATLLPDKTLAAINQEIAPLDATVSPEDEIAFFPPVTGG